MYECKLSKCISVFERGEGMIGVVYGDYDTFHVNSNRTIREFKEPYSRTKLVKECIVHSGALILKEALDLFLQNS